MNIKIALIFSPLMFLPTVAFAADRSLSASLLINFLPVFLFILFFWLAMKYMMKKPNDASERIADSAEKIERHLKRIADHFEKNS